MKVIFPIEVYRTLRAYVEQIDIEISGMGKVIKERDGDETVLRVLEVRIFKQTVTGTNTVLDRNALGKFYDELLREGQNMGDWKLWWHSHHMMGAFFSGIDLTTIENFDTETLDNNWLLSLVTTHQEESSVRCDIFQPIRVTVECNIEIDYGDKKLRDEIKKEIKEKVKEPSLFGNFWSDLKNSFKTEIVIESKDKTTEKGQNKQSKKKNKMKGEIIN